MKGRGETETSDEKMAQSVFSSRNAAATLPFPELSTPAQATAGRSSTPMIVLAINYLRKFNRLISWSRRISDYSVRFTRADSPD